MRDDNMSSRDNINDSDEGKKVVNTEGEQIGMISEVKGGEAYVDLDPDLSDKIRSKLGWDDADQDAYKLPADSIDEVTDDEVRISQNT